MATKQHSISRRVVIGALGVAPIIASASVVGAPPIAELSSGARWRAVVERHRRLRAEWAAHPYGRTHPNSPDYERFEAEEGLIAARSSRAFRAVLRTAAPDFDALVEKLELFDEEFGEDLDGMFTCLINDARRLSACSGAAGSGGCRGRR